MKCKSGAASPWSFAVLDPEGVAGIQCIRQLAEPHDDFLISNIEQKSSENLRLLLSLDQDGKSKLSLPGMIAEVTLKD